MNHDLKEDYIKARWYMWGYLIGNVIKVVIEDLKKARWYLSRVIGDYRR